MEVDEKLSALCLYFSSLEDEIDRKLYRAKRETRRLHTIYDSIRPREVSAPEEPRDEHEVLSIIYESRHQKMPEVVEAPKELTQFEIFQQEVEKFRNSPAMMRKRFSSDFISRMRQLSNPTTSQFQERIDENTKLLRQQLLKLSKLDTKKPQNAYTFNKVYDFSEQLINKYKDICNKYNVTETVDPVFKESDTWLSDEDADKERQTDFQFASFSSKYAKPLRHKQIFELRNDARMSLISSRMRKRTKQALLPFINKDPTNLKESKPTFNAAKTAVSIFSDQSKQWLSIYQ